LTGIRAVLAVVRHQLFLARAKPFPTIVAILVPINFLILFSLFALSGGRVPIAVYQQHPSAGSQAVVSSLSHSDTYTVDQVPTQAAAQRAMNDDTAVAMIGIPATAGSDLAAGKQAMLRMKLNNLNEDFSDDARRGLPLAFLNYYRHDPAHPLPVSLKELDTYPSTVGFFAYIAVSILTVALVIGGLLQGGLSAAKEWEDGTMKELLLSPVPAWSVVVGKLIAAVIGGLLSGACILAILGPLGVVPHAWWAMLGAGLVLLIVFVGIGLAVGSRLRSQRAVVPLSFALGLPLFFISGAFGPISWTTSANALIARIFPVAYANAAVQHATYGYWPIDVSSATVWLVLAGWAVVGVGLSVLIHHRATAAH
jgi:ABC-2 type transport system permease protein